MEELSQQTLQVRPGGGWEEAEGLDDRRWSRTPSHAFTLALLTHTPPSLPRSLLQGNEALNGQAQSIGDLEAEIRQVEEASAASERRLAEVRMERDRLQNARKEVWARDTELRMKVEGLQMELRKRRMVRARFRSNGTALAG